MSSPSTWREKPSIAVPIGMVPDEVPLTSLLQVSSALWNAQSPAI
jgi:hypothetical protein